MLRFRHDILISCDFSRPFVSRVRRFFDKGTQIDSRTDRCDSNRDSLFTDRLSPRHMMVNGNQVLRHNVSCNGLRVCPRYNSRTVGPENSTKRPRNSLAAASQFPPNRSWINAETVHVWYWERNFPISRQHVNPLICEILDIATKTFEPAENGFVRFAFSSFICAVVAVKRFLLFHHYLTSLFATLP
jgi:hypothetical protein